ncbi:hypothetical protein [Kitasatospora sp. NPDC056531]|uniref:hypothetical protein n=1 Tax=Kitasatospora sp. NPDC056531 TaxID=3345856 RepID=UPI0036C60B41
MKHSVLDEHRPTPSRLSSPRARPAGPAPPTTAVPPERPSSEQLLAERPARGEIETDEYGRTPAGPGGGPGGVGTWKGERNRPGSASPRGVVAA